MKKTLSFFLSFLFYIGLFAQGSLILSNANGALTWGDTVHVFIANNEAHEEHVFVTNSSTADIDVKVRKDEISVLAGAFNTFCWGQCFSPTVTESQDAITISAGATNTNDFYADYFADGADGLTVVRYIFFDENQPNDSADVYIFFHTSPTSISEQISLKTEISNPYPNPASTKCHFSYTIPMTANDARIVIMDIAGNTSLSTTIPPGDGKVTVDVSSLASGVYFYSLWVFDKPHTTRKLMIQK
jgi:hypothetical protein